MNIEQVEIEKLIPYARNPRKNDAAVNGVAASIKEFGFKQPVVIDKDNTIVVGHTRVKAAQKLGLDKVPCLRADDLTPQQIKAYRILDNKVAEKSEWDEELLQLELGEIELDLEPFDVEFDLGSADLSEDDYDPPEEISTNLKPGDLIELGRHRVLCGDSASRVDIDKLLRERQAPSIVFTDPPYGVAIGAKNRFLNTFQKSGRNLSDIVSDEAAPADLRELLLPAFRNIKSVMADDCTVFVTAPQGGGLGMMMMMMMQEAGLEVRHVLIWKKNQPTFSMGRLDYDYQHEPILLTWGKRHKRPMKGEHRTSVWEIDRERACAAHPTMKPIALVANALLNNSDLGDTCLDAFLGSGTTLIACEQLGRTCDGMEIEPKYCQVVIDRYRKYCTDNGKEFACRINGEPYLG